jgi:hypothetical protein
VVGCCRWAVYTVHFRVDGSYVNNDRSLKSFVFILFVWSILECKQSLLRPIKHINIATRRREHHWKQNRICHTDDSKREESPSVWMKDGLGRGTQCFHRTVASSTLDVLFLPCSLTNWICCIYTAHRRQNTKSVLVHWFRVWYATLGARDWTLHLNSFLFAASSSGARIFLLLPKPMRHFSAGNSPRLSL